MVSQIKNVKKVMKNENAGSYGDALYVNGRSNFEKNFLSKLHFLFANNIISDLISKYSKKIKYI